MHTEGGREGRRGCHEERRINEWYQYGGHKGGSGDCGEMETAR